MKHKDGCLIYVGCTCDLQGQLKNNKEKLNQVKELLQNLEAYIEANDKLFEDKYVSPDDVDFLRKFNKNGNK